MKYLQNLDNFIGKPQLLVCGYTKPLRIVILLTRSEIKHAHAAHLPAAIHHEIYAFLKGDPNLSFPNKIDFTVYF